MRVGSTWVCVDLIPPGPRLRYHHFRFNLQFLTSGFPDEGYFVGQIHPTPGHLQASFFPIPSFLLSPLQTTISPEHNQHCWCFLGKTLKQETPNQACHEQPAPKTTLTIMLLSRRKTTLRMPGIHVTIFPIHRSEVHKTVPKMPNPRATSCSVTNPLVPASGIRKWHSLGFLSGLCFF